MNKAILTIVNNVAEAIYRSTGKALDVNSTKFVTDFNDIANVIRSRVPKDTTPEQLAAIITKEVTNYTQEHIQEYTFHKPKIKPVTKVKRKFVLNSKTSTLDTPLKNVMSVKLLDINIQNNNLIINELNNELVVVEDVGTDKRLFTIPTKITLEPGDYTVDYLVEELQYLFNAAKFEHRYYIYYDNICKKVCITTVDCGSKTTSINRIKGVTVEKPLNFKFDDSSTMLDILKISKIGEVSNTFISETQVRLIKNTDIKLEVYSVNGENVIPIFQEYFLENHEKFYKKLDSVYSFDNSTELDSFIVKASGIYCEHDFTITVEVTLGVI